MAQELQSKRVAVLATDGVEQVELTEPVKALKGAGANVTVIAPKSGEIQGYNHHDKGDRLKVDAPLDGADPEQFDALVLPGGVMNPDTLRMNSKAVAFVKSFFRSGKPVAAICHGPWMLVEADVVNGRRLTSWPSLKTDLRNAGAEWVDETVVQDSNLVTSRNPDDLPAFCPKMIELFKSAGQAKSTAA
jgi:protease I